MIERVELFPLAFYKKQNFYGSMGKMNYRLAMKTEEVEPDKKESYFLATIWPGPFNYDHTDDALKESKRYPFTEEGITEAIAWFNEKGKSYCGF